MAEEKKAEGAEDKEKKAEAEAAPAKSKLPLLIGAAVGVLVLAVGGAWFFGVFGHKAAPEAAEASEGTEHEPAAEGGKLPAAGEVGGMVALDPFIANLSDEDGRRYLKATLQLEFTKTQAPAEFSARLPLVRDLLLTLFSSKTFAEVRTPQGKAVLRDEIVARVNHALHADVVKAVYFTEFIVQ